MGFWDAATTGFNSGMDWADRRTREDREFALKKEAHAADMRERGLRLGALQRVDDATSALTSMESNGVTDVKGYGVGEGGPTGGNPDEYTPVQRAATQREKLGARRGLAAARGDVQGLQTLDTQARGLDIEDTTKANIEKLAKDPAYWGQMAKNLNLNNGRVTIDEGLDPKTKKQVRAPRISYVTDDGGTHAVEPTDAHKKQLALAMAHIEHGDTATGLQLMAGVDKTLAELAAKQFTTQHQAFDSNTKAQGEFDTAQYHQGMLGYHNRMASTAEAKAQAERMQILNPQLNYRIGADGNPEPVITGLRLNARTGGYDPVIQPMGAGGAGLVPSHALQPEAVTRISKDLVGKPIPGAQGQDGRPVVYDENTAYAAAQKQIISGFAPGAGKPGVDPNYAQMFPSAGKPSAAARPAAAAAPPTQSSGVEGLSSLALQRIASDPNHPLRGAADQQLRGLGLRRDAAQRERMTNPEHNPALYQ